MEVFDQQGRKVISEHKTVFDIGGGLTWVICIVLALAVIHYSCADGTATGYLKDVCTRGLDVWDYLGLICCAPVYLLIIILFSGGIRIW
jgi:hypothetical protein